MISFKQYYYLTENFNDLSQKWISQGFDSNEIKNNIDLYKQLKAKNANGLEKDITKLSDYNKFKEHLGQFKQYKSTREVKTISKNVGAEKVYEDDKYTILLIKTKEAAIFYGKGTKWCISAIEDNAFNGYNPKNNIYFIFNKQLTPDNPLYKLALLVHVNGKKKCFNALDEIIKTPKDILALKVFKPKDISQFLESCKPDAAGNFNGNIDLSGLNLKQLPFKYNKVSGDFSCSFNQLESLVGAPKWVGNDFNCSYNQLTSLEGAPKYVGNDFNCSYNQLTSLEGAPKYVGNDFNCSYNKLISLKRAPKYVGGWFNCMHNPLIDKELPSNTVIKGKFFIG
jgi:hypothetical protein